MKLDELLIDVVALLALFLGAMLLAWGVLGCAHASVKTPTLELSAWIAGNATVELCDYMPADQACAMATSCASVTTSTESSIGAVLGGAISAVGIYFGGIF